MPEIQPSKIKVGPLDYEMLWYDRAAEDREARYGYTDNNELEIGVSDRLSPPKKCDTTMHEWIHALWFVLNMKKTATEEEVASSLGIGITMLARDNREVFQWWLDHLHEGVAPQSSGKKLPIREPKQPHKSSKIRRKRLQRRS